MTDEQRIAAISVNLLRISEWYYKDAVANASLCQRFLDQSRTLAAQVQAPAAQEYLQKIRGLSLESPAGSGARTAERFLTLGVLLQHPEKWMTK